MHVITAAVLVLQLVVTIAMLVQQIPAILLQALVFMSMLPMEQPVTTTMFAQQAMLAPMAFVCLEQLVPYVIKLALRPRPLSLPQTARADWVRRWN